jgi:alpha-galactosidase
MANSDWSLSRGKAYFLPGVSVLIFSLLSCFVSVVNGQKGQSGISDNQDICKWVEQNFAKGKTPPFSFVYGGKKSDSFIRNWQYKSDKLKTEDSDIQKYAYTYTDPISGLSVNCRVTCFKEFQAVEWVLNLSNTSSKNSQVIEKVLVADKSFIFESGNTFTLHYARGSNAMRSDFQPLDRVMRIDEHVYMTPSGGRSSDNTAFPFFNIESSSNAGIVVSIGWTGKWFADVTQPDEKSVLLKSGMEGIHLALYPGEEIRTPRVCLLFWEGANRMTGHNQFRQFILKHHSRKIDGRFAEYPLSGSFDYGDPQPCQEYTCLTEEYAVALVKRYQYFKVLPELFWLDAGWYTGCGWDKEKGEWWQNVGNWTVDKERFPNGLKPVADAVHKTGSKFMVWFEPERVRPGTMIDKEHSEWLIKLPGNDNYLFNLGITEARLWLTDYLSDFLRKEGIDYYRQDFNFDPLPYWNAGDRPDRKGISEIRYIEGLYAFWDSLLVRFPNLLIDNCASGGRRIDLETTSRSSPLWRTDYQYGEPNGYQCHTFGLNFYLPIHGTAIYKTDDYTFRSGLGGTAVMNWEVTGRDSESILSIQKKIDEYKILKPYFYGDFYPLSDSRDNTGDNKWLAYQLNRPVQKDGIILAFRRSGCMDDSISTKPAGLDENAEYELSYEDYGIKVRIRGSELMNNLNLAIPQKPGSLLIRYRMIE